jgi:hypothetical protein
MLRALKGTLENATQRDPEQEVQGIALPALDAALVYARDLLPDNPVVSQIDDLISPATVEAGEPIRAIDALLVVDVLFGALKPQPSFGTANSRP